MPCPACKYDVQDWDQGCPECLRALNMTTAVKSAATVDKSLDKASVLLPVLGFAVPPGGLLFYFLHWKRYPQLASSVAFSSLAGSAVATLGMFMYAMLFRS